MKNIFLSIFVFAMSMLSLQAQIDTMYIMKTGNVVYKRAISEIDSIIFYNPSTNPTCPISITDSRDGKIYNVVKIGNQCWMAENLKYLPLVVSPDSGSETAPYYYVYGYNGTVVVDAKATANYTTYGVLYNWTATMNGAASSTTNPSGVQGICPTGWHLPSDAEWTELTDYLGGESVAGSKLKESGTTHWTSPNTGNNISGFTALPGGYRNETSSFDRIGDDAYWWSSTEGGPSIAWHRGIGYEYDSVGIGNDTKVWGFSVRCVKD